MAKETVDLKTLKDYCKKLNKLDLTDEIDIGEYDNVDELAEAFVEAMEDIDDNGKTDGLAKNKKIVNYYNMVLEFVENGGSEKSDDSDEDEDDDEPKKTKNNKKKGKEKMANDLLEKLAECEDNDDIEEFIEENDLDEDDAGFDDDNKFKKNMKSVKAYVEGLSKSGDSDDKDEDEDEDEKEPSLEDQLNGMDFKQMKKFVKTNSLTLKKDLNKDKFDKKKKKYIAEIVSLMGSKNEEADEDDEDEDEKPKKKGKGKDKPKKEKTEKGTFKAGSNPAKFHEKLSAGDCKLSELAKLCDKTEAVTIGLMIKMMASKTPFTVTYSGAEIKDAVVSLKK